MRMSYSNQNEEKPKAIIFDWDDTILPSTFVDQHKVEKFTDFPLEVRALHSFRFVVMEGEVLSLTPLHRFLSFG